MAIEIVDSIGDDRVARVYIGSLDDGSKIEFVESTPSKDGIEDKWVLILSTLKGCPVGCPMCDAGGDYGGTLSADEILEQIDHMVERRFPGGRIDSDKFKVQFARMGEPAFNDEVLNVMTELPGRYDARGLNVSLSTIAPEGREEFFRDLIDVKNEFYRGRFQLQFSIHTTDPRKRDELIPCGKWSFERIAEYGNQFKKDDDKKITLNFISFRDVRIDPDVLAKQFDPDTFLIKITPLNPTGKMKVNGLESGFDPDDPSGITDLISDLESKGFEVILSIGNLEENRIGSNCGQYVDKNRERIIPGSG